MQRTSPAVLRTVLGFWPVTDPYLLSKAIRDCEVSSLQTLKQVLENYDPDNLGRAGVPEASRSTTDPTPAGVGACGLPSCTNLSATKMKDLFQLPSDSLL